MTESTAHTIPGVLAWRHDLVGCLWTSAGTVLGFNGAPIIETLGAAWGFRHFPGDVRREEYYYPCAPGVSLWEAIAPYHPVRSAWCEPSDPDEGWEQVRAEVLAGRPAIVAADNFELPFRPAYRDVHTNHLVTVYGFDDKRGTARVLDAVPPRFDGDIGIKELTAARDSANPILHDRDMFFTDRPIANRWLRVEVDVAAFPPFDPATVRATIRRNLDGFADSTGSGLSGLSGLSGQRAYLEECVTRLRSGEAIWEELFLVAGAVLANTALHADWLTTAADRFGYQGLREAARAVERVAHHWSAVRIAGVLTRDAQVSAERLSRRFAVLQGDHARALADLEYALARW